MEKDSFVSIIIPTYNRAKKILTPINSIIEQTFIKWKIIIIDDGSTDNTADVLKPYIETYKIHYEKLPRNLGPSAARNVGMKLVDTEYAAFIDSDDAWGPTFLEKLVGLLNKTPECALAYCDSQIYDLSKNPYYIFTFEPYNYQVLLDSYGMIPTGSFVFRTECWRQLDGFREDMIRGEDFEWQLRFGEIFDFIRYSAIMHYYYRDKDGLICSNVRLDEVKLSSQALNETKAKIKNRRS
jgi:glycosyltransferase involved in cell wall biosynthesis